MSIDWNYRIGADTIEELIAKCKVLENGLPTEQGATQTSETMSDHRTFVSGATRDTDKGKLDYEAFLCPRTMLRYAEFMHKHRTMGDGSIRDGDNWQRGIPLDALIKSGTRHTEDWKLHHRGYSECATETLENSLCGVLFNVLGYLKQVLDGKGEEGAEKEAPFLTVTGNADWGEQLAGRFEKITVGIDGGVSSEEDLSWGKTLGCHFGDNSSGDTLKEDYVAKYILNTQAMIYSMSKKRMTLIGLGSHQEANDLLKTIVSLSQSVITMSEDNKVINRLKQIEESDEGAPE